jgi:hypothetical protein
MPATWQSSTITEGRHMPVKPDLLEPIPPGEILRIEPTVQSRVA